MLKKIVVIGPECTGKSTLCQQLAEHYNTIWCPEYAREYLLSHGKKYNYDDLFSIAKGQIKLEEETIQSAIGNELLLRSKSKSHSDFPLFIDTDMYVMKVWSEFVFDKCHPYILYQLTERKYDLYLLCNVDLPWVADELREYPDLKTRERLYHIYKKIMENQATPWIEISGDNDDRLQKSIDAVDDLLSESVFAGKK
jgi:NadR type nicotinamide-nucleotide adenylyltransferase